MNDIMKIVKTLEKPGLLTKGISETVQNEVKKQNWGLLGMLVATLASSFPGNMLVPKDLFEQVKQQLEHVKEKLQYDRIFNTASSYN